VRGHGKSALCWLFVVVLFSFAICCHAATRVTCDTPASPHSEPTEYFVSLANSSSHIAHVSIRLASFSGDAELEMPVWNALYQVRNFSAHVEDVRATERSEKPDGVIQTGTSAWDVRGAAGCATVSYDIYLDVPGAFGSELTADHAFFNWAMVLMYSPGLRSLPVSVRLLDVPATWALRDTHVFGGSATGRVGDAIGVADNYDTLVDSPAELGGLHQYAFQQDGATYHIAVQGNPSTYDNVGLENALMRLTHATVDWMQDRPYNEYTFLYDFPKGPAGGGMEHAFGTAISASAASGKVNLDSLASISAHEFFHLWNVKRIRPQSLEPIDYQHQQNTRALWFSEGVTSTVSELMLARAGLIDELQYRKHLAAEITEFESRPARTWQSAEQSSLDAWLEGSPFYRTPQRSISYYNKGEIVGMLLDLRIRQLTRDTKSLRDLFHWLNEHYAKQHRYFPDSAGVEEAAENITGQSFADFFRDYVSGVKPIPYEDFFRFVGLQLTTENVTLADPGFSSTSNLDGESAVTSVTPGSDAARAGLSVGDRILEVNGQPAVYHLDRELARLIPGQTVKLRIGRAGKEHTLKIKVGSRREQELVLADVAGLTPEQRAHRAAWIHGDDEPGGAH
jgi:predicted metalloprotease with PDZ domain